MGKSTIAAIGLAAMLTAQGVAEATDYCFTLSPGNTIAVPSFKLPKPGKCSTFKKGAYYSSDGSPVLGTACTTTDGTTMRMTYSYIDNVRVSYSGHFEFPYPGLGTGPYWFIQSQDETSFEASGSATAAPCATPVPIN